LPIRRSLKDQKVIQSLLPKKDCSHLKIPPLIHLSNILSSFWFFIRT